MTDRENFIARWSRRKRATADDADATKAATTPADADYGAQESERGASESVKRDASATPIAGSELPFDLTKLPPIESIGADTDIRAFLAPGVPTELTRAALRRAWAADPKVRDFVGLADYDWDFNTPGAIPGFGPLEMTDELRRQVADMVGRSFAAAESERPAATPPAAPNDQAVVETSEALIESGTTAGLAIKEAPSNVGSLQDESISTSNESYNSKDIPQKDKGHIAPQHNSALSDDVQLIAKRPHGRALPK
jgi:hypothetical protein